MEIESYVAISKFISREEDDLKFQDSRIQKLHPQLRFPHKSQLISLFSSLYYVLIPQR